MVSKLKEIRDALLTWEPSADYLDHLRQRVASPTEAADQLATVCDWTFRLHLAFAGFLVAAALAFLGFVVGILVDQPFDNMCAAQCVLIAMLFIGAAIAVWFAVEIMTQAATIRRYYTAQMLDRWLQ